MMTLIRAEVSAVVEQLRTADEARLRDMKVPWPHTDDELQAIVSAVVVRDHDYGTCVYAMSIAAQAAFNLVAHKLGVSGFQASCADMEFLSRTRGMKMGFQVLDYAKLMYPQHRYYFDSISFDNLIEKNKKVLAKEATQLLAEAHELAHPDVLAHWRWLASL